MPIFTEGSIRHVTIYALGNQEMTEEMGNQSQKYIGEKKLMEKIYILPYLTT